MTTALVKNSVPFTSDERRRGLFYLSLAVGAVSFALAVQMGLNANFLKEELKFDGFQMGLLEALRESCGIWALIVLALLAGVCEPLVGALMLVLVAVGLGGYAVAPSFWWVAAMSLVWSQGLHVWMPLPQSMVMAFAEPGKTGHRMGQVGAAGAIGFGSGLGTSLLLSWAGVPMRPMYVVALGVALLGALACLRIPRAIGTERPRLVFRQRYWRYYLLCFLEGWRKQIFVCFAGFLLVERHQVGLSTMLLLMIMVQLVGVFTSSRVGRLIDRVGERPVLFFYYGCLILFFVGYALIQNKHALQVLFVVDNAFFVFGMALNTYVNKLVPPAERTGTLSMGVAMNHVAAVSMPLLGGVLWVTLGYQWAFLTGALAGCLSIGAVVILPHLEHPVQEPT